MCSEVQGKRKTSWDGAVQEMRAVILGHQKKKKGKALWSFLSQANASIIWVC